MLDNKAQNGRGNRGGNGFSFDEPKRGDRDGKGGRGGRDDRRGGHGGPRGRAPGVSYRIDNELSAVEKALTKKDLGAMVEPLQAVLRALKPMHLSSLDQLDMGARGRLLTTLMRVQRTDKPAGDAAPSAPAADAPAADGAETSSSETNTAPAEAASDSASAPAEAAADAGSTTTADASAAAADAGAAAGVGADVVAPAPASPAEKTHTPYSDVQFTIGLIWSAISEKDRAETAFSKADRQPTEADLAMPPAPAREARPERAERGPRRERGDRKERGERRERSERRDRPERRERPEPFVSSGDWQADVQKLESMGRTRDAGRLYEKNNDFAGATRLFEAGGDLKSALRTAALGKLDEVFNRLAAGFKDAEISEVLERAAAWEKLMEFHVGKGNFEGIAKLYERAGQFDQAALAWERAGKLTLARKSYERAKDFGAAKRVREAEVKKLIERGDLLGAATLQLASNQREEALETLKVLPAAKTYGFLKKLKLNDEAAALAKAELEKAEAEGKALDKGRWLELTGRYDEAAEVYLAAGRQDKAGYAFESQGNFARAAQLLEAAALLDKAQALYAKAGDVANVERVKALPRPEKKAKPVESEAKPEEAVPPEAVAGASAVTDTSANA